MIEGNDKLIIICGMAHSGTTIVAHILRQHPDLTLFNNGPMAHFLENDFLLNADINKIKSLLKDKKRIILKRPWVEDKLTDWLVENMPDANYIYCLKDKESIIKSWSAFKSNVNTKFRNSSYEEKSKSYDGCYSNAMKLKNKVKNFFIVNNDKLISDPNKMFNDIDAFLKIKQFNYILSDVSSINSIKNKLINCKKEINIKNNFKML